MNKYFFFLIVLFIYTFFYYNLCFNRELTSKDPRSELGYRLTVQVDTHDPTKPLTVVHVPSLTCKVRLNNL